MTYEAIKKILDKYKITSLSQLEEQLEYYINTLDPHYDDCADDPIDKDCTNANCYEDFFVPDCRKLIEIYNKYFKKDISNRRLFIEHLVQNTSKKKSSIENYLYCRSCNQQIRKGTQASLKLSDSKFKKDFCNNLDIKFDYVSLFETDYQSIKQFLNKEHQITSDTFVPQYNQSENIMTKDEEKQLFEISHTSKEEFKSNLGIEENLQGGYSYLLNLALNAFDRSLVDECEMVLNKIEESFKKNTQNEEYIQLKAKVLSSKNKDKEAIELLEKLIQITQPKIDPETHNLLAASIKRDTFNEYRHYSDEKLLVKNLNKAKDIYYTVYKLNNDYYPALNFIYLNFILAYITNEDKYYFEKIINEAKEIWANTNHKVIDWWSFISNIEYLILTGQYSDAEQLLKTHFNDLEKDEITEFNISSTLRQLNLYSEFCSDKKLKDIIDYIQNINP